MTRIYDRKPGYREDVLVLAKTSLGTSTVCSVGCYDAIIDRWLIVVLAVVLGQCLKRL